MGVDVSSIWESMRAGRSAIGEITTVPLDGLKIRIGAEVKRLPEVEFDRRRLAAMDRYSLLAVLAAGEALRQSGVVVSETNTGRIGAVVGTGLFGAETLEDNYRGLFIAKRSRANVLAVPRAMPSAPTGQVSIAYGLRGPVFGISSGCSSSNHALISATDQLRLGRADVMLVGGTDAPLTYGVLKAWEARRAVARETCRPFSADRDGLVLGEGAAMAVLETYEHAAARGAPILAELAGAGISGDASGIVAPTVEGRVAAMRSCLADAGLLPEDIDYVNANGTGTKLNDSVETQAIRQVFGKHADALSVSSTKSMHAHCMGASGAIELIACVMAIRNGIIPPTANYREKDPGCDLDVTPNIARQRKVRAAISNDFAFGGTNAVVAITEA
ncbi:beta-ACP synthase [Mesorhizobium amorphae]|nr:beta-ACP synthase [Mesorhizobium amorphae]